VSITTTCPACHSQLKVEDSLAGKRCRCPRCKGAMQVPVAPPSVDPAPPPSPSPSAGPAAKPLSSKKRLAAILDAFEGEFPRVRSTLAYRLGILFVTFAVLLLPLIYLALIAGAGYFVYWHATANVGIVKAVRNVWAILFLYVGPLVAGAILIVFMIKPLFARPARGGLGRKLKHGQEPLLFAFVDRIADAVGAPEPQQIRVDCDVNASASFGRGLMGLFGRKLVLTIGLPLAAGLDVQQLAGVLAHELGHFAQGAGMRLSYVIRSVNGWFHRVVFERDEWDEALARACQESGRLGLIFLVALLGVWLTRGILFILMMLGHAISCVLLRQMEYDADRYEARLAGSAAFAATSRRIMLLAAGEQAALPALVDFYQSGEFPENYPALLLHTVEQLPSGLRRCLNKETAGGKTGLFDTHPSFADRIASARRENAPGIFHLDWPATALFSNFDELTRQTSLDFYRRLFGRQISANYLVGSKE
jgi:Zn-dependent protease with chaperone function